MKLCVCEPDASFRHYGTLESLRTTMNLFQKDKMHYPLYDRGKELIIDYHPIKDGTDEDYSKNLDTIYRYFDNEFENYIIAIPWADRIFSYYLQEAGIPWMFSTYCRTSDMLQAQMNWNPSQITIVEELAFHLKDITLAYPNVKIRLIGNIAQCYTGTNREVSQITKFFIRPEDIKFYEPYIHAIELVGAPDKLSVIYEIYQKREWQGDISLIIQDLNINFPNSTLPPGFGEERINCKKKCVYNKCSTCEVSVLFANYLTNLKVSFKTIQNNNTLWEWKPK